MSRPTVLVSTILVGLALIGSSCGRSTDADPTDAADSTADAGTTSRRTTTTEPTTSTTTDPDTDTDPDSDDDDGDDGDGAEAEDPAADVVIDGSLRQGELLIDDRRFEVPIGSTVLITFESDEVEHIHLHGYDLLADLTPGQPAELAFVADSPGTFEVELEDSGRFVFELLVR